MQNYCLRSILKFCFKNKNKIEVQVALISLHIYPDPLINYKLTKPPRTVLEFVLKTSFVMRNCKIPVSVAKDMTGDVIDSSGYKEWGYPPPVFV
jgi:hypothetical protein